MSKQDSAQQASTEKHTLYCSFCGKSQHEVEKLIAGPTVFICNECVALCAEIINEECVRAGKGSFASMLLSEKGVASDLPVSTVKADELLKQAFPTGIGAEVSAGELIGTLYGTLAGIVQRRKMDESERKLELEELFALRHACEEGAKNARQVVNEKMVHLANIDARISALRR